MIPGGSGHVYIYMCIFGPRISPWYGIFIVYILYGVRNESSQVFLSNAKYGLARVKCIFNVPHFFCWNPEPLSRKGYYMGQPDRTFLFRSARQIWIWNLIFIWFLLWLRMLIKTYKMQNAITFGWFWERHKLAFFLWEKRVRLFLFYFCYSRLQPLAP